MTFFYNAASMLFFPFFCFTLLFVCAIFLHIKGGRAGGQYFVNLACVGMDARVLRFVC